MTEQPTLTCTPIGYLRAGPKAKFHAPRQPRDAKGERIFVVELNDDPQLEIALRDVAGFDRIWLLWWCHRNTGWRSTVLPPRGPGVRRGVFATRSPHRPNPLAMSAVRLHSINGRQLIIGDCDLVEGTPILDIKPYIPRVDSFPDSAIGWLAAVDAAYAQPPPYQVTLAPAAEEQLRWLHEVCGVELFDEVREVVERDPRPHRTRRIVRVGKDQYRIGCGAWRAFFVVVGNLITISHITPGFPEHLLRKDNYAEIADKEAQIAFLERYGVTCDSDSQSAEGSEDR